MKILWNSFLVLLCILWSNISIRRVYGDGCHTEHNGCCVTCKPGFLLHGTCGPCKPCPKNGYMNLPNKDPTCIRCKRCEGIFEYSSRCSATQNAVCKCIAGKRCVDEKCNQCEDNPCTAGTQLSGEGCVKCPPGTFNSGTEGNCQPWKNCSSMGAILSINGTSVSDVVCLPKPSKIPTTTTTVITLTTKAQEVPTYGMSVTIVVIPVICFIIVSLAIFLCLSLRLEKIKNKFKKIKQTEQEDACSYHYPEEEHGGEEETLSPEP